MACTKRREKLSFAKEVKQVACGKRRENEPVAKAGQHRTCSKWRENERNVSRKPKLERDFVKRQFLSKVCSDFLV